MTTVEILRAARDLISTPDKWTQGAEARDDVGCEVSFYSTNAFCFCTLGAVYCVRGNTDSHPALEALVAQVGARYAERPTDPDDMDEDWDGSPTVRRNPDDAIPDFNDADETTHADVLGLFSRAIAAVEAQS